MKPDAALHWSGTIRDCAAELLVVMTLLSSTCPASLISNTYSRSRLLGFIIYITIAVSRFGMFEPFNEISFIDAPRIKVGSSHSV
jgi:hypothetical protein